ncbi:MAG: hypothetical protein FWF44_11390 [Defluviitaleaceae bacterium]|nr:hypothetical protein [Defluviitaleaceae bacterium]
MAANKPKKPTAPNGALTVTKNGKTKTLRNERQVAAFVSAGWKSLAAKPDGNQQ